MTYKVTCVLIACIQGSAPGPTLGNEYGRKYTIAAVAVFTERWFCAWRYFNKIIWLYLHPNFRRGLKDKMFMVVVTRSYGLGSVCTVVPVVGFIDFTSAMYTGIP